MLSENDLRFVVDRTAGRLARWLRVLGLDVEYADTCEPSCLTKTARQSGRVLITRNRDLAGRLTGNSILLESEHLEEQIGQVIKEIGVDRCYPFSRCNVCNAELLQVDRDKVQGRVPDFVYRNHDGFSLCPVCGRYYWRGTHWDRMDLEIRKVMGGQYGRRKGRDSAGDSGS